MTEPSAHPADFRRRVLLCSVGLSPQVASETVWALGCAGAWRPTELWLLTTSAGTAPVESLLLARGTGALDGLAADWDAPWAAALARSARVVTVETPTGDLDTAAAFAHFADEAAAVVRELCADPAAAVHVSLAGGRKSASAALALAIALYGRDQDRLSHVLVEEEFAANPAFFYPPPRPTPLLGRDGRLRDAASVSVSLVDLPFPRLRRFAPAGSYDFATAVRETQAAIERHLLRVDLGERRITWQERPLPMPPAIAAWLAWLADDLVKRGQGVPRVGADLANYLEAYGRLAGTARRAAAARRICDPPDAEWMEEKASRLAKLAETCGIRPRGARLVARTGPRAAARYRLALDPHEVEWVGAPLRG